MKWILVIVFTATGQMGYKHHETEKACYISAAKLVKEVKANKIKGVGWKCFREDDEQFNEVMKQIRQHMRKDTI